MNAAGELALVARVTVSLVVVVLLVLLAARLARRAGLRGTGTAVRVRERVPLSREAFLAVVEVADRGLVLGVGPQGVRLLSELDPQTLAASYPDPGEGPDGTGSGATVRTAWRRARSGARSGGEDRTPRRRRDDVAGVEVGADGVKVTRIGPAGTAPAQVRRGTGSVLDPRTWRQFVEALRELTVRRR